MEAWQEVLMNKENKLKTIFMICGKQGSGKTTLSYSLINKNSKLVSLKFAGPLYEMHTAIGDICDTYGIPFKEKEGSLLQFLGTEWGRKTKGENVWVDALKNQSRGFLLMDSVDGIIVDDCRFENEFVAFDIGPHKVVKVLLGAPEDVRKGRADGWRDNTNHPSETGLDHISWDSYDFVFDTSKVSVKEIIEIMGV